MLPLQCLHATHYLLLLLCKLDRNKTLWISWICFLYLLRLEILDSKLLKDFVPAGVALQIDSTVRAGDHLWRVTFHLEDNFYLLLKEDFHGQYHIWGDHIHV